MHIAGAGDDRKTNGRAIIYLYAIYIYIVAYL